MMPKEKADYYISIGLSANAKDQAVALEKTLREASDLLRASSGFTAGQFLPILAGIRERCDAFEEAMAARDKFAEDIRAKKE